MASASVASPIFATPSVAVPSFATPIFATASVAFPADATPIFATPIFATLIFATPIFATAFPADATPDATPIFTRHFTIGLRTQNAAHTSALRVASGLLRNGLLRNGHPCSCSGHLRSSFCGNCGSLSCTSNGPGSGHGNGWTFQFHSVRWCVRNARPGSSRIQPSPHIDCRMRCSWLSASGCWVEPIWLWCSHGAP